MNKAKLKKVLEKLPVKDQLIKLRQELKDKRNKELFAFLQQTIKNVESKKPIHEVKSESQSLLENLDKKKEESSPLEAKIEAEKPAFQVDEKIYGTCHIALGNNTGFGGKVNVPLHLDGIIKKPTISVDNKKIMESGRLL